MATVDAVRRSGTTAVETTAAIAVVTTEGVERPVVTTEGGGAMTVVVETTVKDAAAGTIVMADARLQAADRAGCRSAMARDETPRPATVALTTAVLVLVGDRAAMVVLVQVGDAVNEVDATGAVHGKTGVRVARARAAVNRVTGARGRTEALVMTAGETTGVVMTGAGETTGGSRDSPGAGGRTTGAAPGIATTTGHGFRRGRPFPKGSPVGSCRRRSGRSFDRCRRRTLNSLHSTLSLRAN